MVSDWYICETYKAHLIGILFFNNCSITGILAKLKYLDNYYNEIPTISPIYTAYSAETSTQCYLFCILVYDSTSSDIHCLDRRPRVCL